MYKIPSGTLFLGKNLMVLPECPSTNTVAMELAQTGKVAEGTVVITHNQTSGRGQRGNSWESARGLNLTLSVILHPAFLQATQQFCLNKAVALAVQDVVKTYAGFVCVKWPNDIMIGNRKVCGILIENQLSGSQISRSVAGIGLNVNQASFGSPQATGLVLHSKELLDLPKVFEHLMQALEWRYLQLKGGHIRRLDDDYLDGLYRVNESHPYIVDGRETMGIIRNVDASGRLLVEVEGAVRAFDLKEIKYVH